MAEQEAKKLEAESPVAPAPAEAKSDVAHDKATVPTPEEKPDDSKALAVVESEHFLLFVYQKLHSMSLCMIIENWFQLTYFFRTVCP